MLAGAPQALRGRRAHGECGRGTLLLAGGFLLLLQAPSGAPLPQTGGWPIPRRPLCVRGPCWLVQRPLVQ